MANLPNVYILTQEQTVELLSDCIDNLSERVMLDTLSEILSKDQIDELAARAENEDKA
jgi:hypothetical protein